MNDKVIISESDPTVYTWADVKPAFHPRNELTERAEKLWHIRDWYIEADNWDHNEALADLADDLMMMNDVKEQCACTPIRKCYLCRKVEEADKWVMKFKAEHPEAKI